MLFINKQSSNKETSIGYLGVFFYSQILVGRATLTILLKKSIEGYLGILSKLRYFLDTKTLLSLNYTFVEPFLNYCILAWGNAYQSTLQPFIYITKESKE